MRIEYLSVVDIFYIHFLANKGDGGEISDGLYVGRILRTQKNLL
jgi:hypothetical protein